VQGSREKLSLIELKPQIFDFSRSRRKVGAGSPYAIGADQGGGRPRGGLMGCWAGGQGDLGEHG
jgi:hypothetical protein